jgi:hypothetical protein
MAIHTGYFIMLGSSPRFVIRLHYMAGPAELGAGRKFEEKNKGAQKK